MEKFLWHFNIFNNFNILNNYVFYESFQYLRRYASIGMFEMIISIQFLKSDQSVNLTINYIILYLYNINITRKRRPKTAVMEEGRTNIETDKGYEVI